MIRFIKDKFDLNNIRAIDNKFSFVNAIATFRF